MGIVFTEVAKPDYSQTLGHGHVKPRPDGVVARCGGPLICAECALELAHKNAEEKNPLNA